MTGFVYIAKFGDKVKIGHSVCCRSRMRQHELAGEQVAFIMAVPGSVYDEKRMHDRFSSIRIGRRELFDMPEEALMALLIELKEHFGEQAVDVLPDVDFERVKPSRHGDAWVGVHRIGIRFDDEAMSALRAAARDDGRLVPAMASKIVEGGLVALGYLPERNVGE